eukprot:scaffold7724_cov248-Pinguiococcus_pyrenoidosus.AAC.4
MPLPREYLHHHRLVYPGICQTFAAPLPNRPRIRMLYRIDWEIFQNPWVSGIGPRAGREATGQGSNWAGKHGQEVGAYASWICALDEPYCSALSDDTTGTYLNKRERQVCDLRRGRGVWESQAGTVPLLEKEASYSGVASLGSRVHSVRAGDAARFAPCSAEMWWVWEGSSLTLRRTEKSAVLCVHTTGTRSCCSYAPTRSNTCLGFETLTSLGFFCPFAPMLASERRSRWWPHDVAQLRVPRHAVAGLLRKDASMAARPADASKSSSKTKPLSLRCASLGQTTESSPESQSTTSKGVVQ